MIECEFIGKTLRLTKSSRKEDLAATQLPDRALSMNLENQNLKILLFIQQMLLPNLFAHVLYPILELPALTMSVSFGI